MGGANRYNIAIQFPLLPNGVFEEWMRNARTRDIDSISGDSHSHPRVYAADQSGPSMIWSIRESAPRQ